MTEHTRRIGAGLLAALFFPGAAGATSLDVNTFYRMRALSYKNLYLDGGSNDRSFITQNAQLSAFVRNIPVQLGPYPDQTLDVGLSLRGIGVAGSTTALQSPFDSIASHYPNTSFVPYVESAYVKVKQLFGRPIEATFGQQAFTLGSGLLLADDGVGMTGVSMMGGLPFWDMKAGGFIFQPRNSQAAADSLMVYGLTLELPTEGVWQLNQLVEKDQMSQSVTVNNLAVNKVTRQFTSLRYQMSYGPFVFDGEAAIQRGSAGPGGPSPGNPNGERIRFDANAQVLKAKWRQRLWRTGGEGIARLSFARGSGDVGATRTTDEAFFPSRGHRFDGLERGGFGDFFGATPYDAFGGKSSVTASGLPAGLSGIQTVGIGFTPPAYRGIALDLDYFLFQADRNSLGATRTLGQEYDIRLRYNARDRFAIQAGIAFFKAGDAISPTKPSARRITFEVLGRF
ncbi:MAG: hypothetical protein HY551_03370 [Elusimicrobia bacterium]|nr:hypothetical protein [Elusimicrobiota bacterium]